MITMVDLLGVMAVGASADPDDSTRSHAADGTRAGDGPAPDRSTEDLMAVMDLHAALTEAGPAIDGMSRADELLFSWLSGGPDRMDADDLPFPADHVHDKDLPVAETCLADAALGAGDEIFSVQDLFEDGASLPTVIDDYDQTADALFVVYDSTTHPAPVLSIDATETGAGDALIRIDGQPLAIVTGAAATLRLGHLSLVPDTMLSDALAARA
ncbi:hypothetical protein JMK10_15020 [Rhodovulum sulfidophilum]|uniref:hypothetical protein n=1 Tax=Rhodovulum sulfidophilum TaxID=35806 RepID=UPI001923E7D1|nr:hypothetical protein [Rhodovulum sulfidophilum]MBL3573003.1 hypothetical protein [Rhodovulum sulfidophilum]MCE8430836.1 hypothetical protein [Rhodovulum sulfidophilum]MCF4118093.1 hypothetical protein [Rhodovulum sulfidophilum]